MRETLPETARRSWLTLATLGSLAVAGCDSVLEVTDPDIILDASSAAGAVALKNGVVFRFQQATSGGEFLVYSGLLTDEWISGDTFEQRNSMDQRSTAVTNSFLAPDFRTLNRVRVQAAEAVKSLRSYSPSPTANIGLMFAMAAYAENLIGETYCNGIPLSGIDGPNIVYGPALTYDAVLARAVSDADSALLYVGGTDGPRVTAFAKIIKGRALLNRGRFAEAAAAVAGVSPSFKWDVSHSDQTANNQIWALNNSASRYVVANAEGGTGLNFVTAADPRLPTAKPKPKAFDSATDFVEQRIWDRNTAVTIASGIEALLITAEAALKGDDAPLWLSTLNAARATRTDLPALADPGTDAARVDLLFRERAFWMFSTGHRLGDLRRLIRQYNRAANTVFPSGIHFKGPAYGADVNFPISFDELNNPNAGGTQAASTCTDRNA